MKEEQVTVIVPAYNDESTIETCVMSVLQQTYKNIEVIIVDDGSTDNTGAICDELAQIDKRIQAYHVENRGVAEARNYALKRAKGKYIQFVDANDKIDKNMTYSLVNTMETKNVELVVCGYWKKITKICIKNPKMDNKGIYTPQKYLQQIMKDPGHHYYGVVWNKLYLRDIILTHNNKFQKDVNLGEDFIFNLQYLQAINAVYVIRKHLYYYDCTQKGSLSRDKEKTLESCVQELENRKKIYRIYQETFEKLDMDEREKKKVCRYWEMFYVRNIYYLKHNFLNWSYESKKEWKQKIETNKSIQEYLKQAQDLSITKKLQELLIREYVKKIFVKFTN